MTDQFNNFTALKEMKELWHDVDENMHIPKRFRAAPFTEEIKESYLRLLGKAIDALETRLKTRH